MTLTLREKLKLCLIHLWHLMLDRRAVGVLILKSIVVLSGRGHLIFIAGDKLHPKLAGDVVDDGLREWDVGVLGHAFRFEADVAEFLNQGFEGDAVLEAEGDEGTNGVHQAVDGGAGLGHLDKDFAGLAIFELADGDVAFGTSDAELVGERIARVR